MTTPGRDDREDLALDALIVLALRQNDLGELPDLNQPEPELSPEDEAALAALPPDLVDRLMDDTWVTPRDRLEHSHPHPDLTVALHRSDEDDDLTDKALEEMERRIRDLEEAEGTEDADDRNAD